MPKIKNVSPRLISFNGGKIKLIPTEVYNLKPHEVEMLKSDPIIHALVAEGAIVDPDDLFGGAPERVTQAPVNRRVRTRFVDPGAFAPSRNDRRGLGDGSPDLESEGLDDEPVNPDEAELSGNPYGSPDDVHGAGDDAPEGDPQPLPADEAEALEVVRSAESMGLLQAWYQHDSREAVKREITKRSKRLAKLHANS